MTQSLQALRAEQYQAAEYVRSIINATAGRERSTHEEQQYQEGFRLVEATSAAYRAADLRISEAAALRQIQERQFGNMGAGPNTPRRSSNGTMFGEAIANAISEVRDGRSVAFVDFPETRALAETGIGGYLVNNAMGAPVFALAARSVVMGLPGVRHIDATTGDRLRLPRLNSTNIGGIAEGGALTAAATDLDAVDIIFGKLGSVEILSTEQIEDSSSQAFDIIGQRLLIDLAAKADSQLLQGDGTNGIVGLFNQAGISSTSIAGVATLAHAQAAEYLMLQNDGSPSAWLLSPRSWIGTKGFRTIVTGVASSIQPVLTQDPSQGVNTLSGFPVYTTSAISTTTGATSVGSTGALVDASQIVIVTRRPARLEISRDVNFTTDQVAIRATTRIGLGLLDQAGAVSAIVDQRTA